MKASLRPAQALSVPTVILLGLLIGMPLWAIVRQALFSTGGFSMDAMDDLLADPNIRDVLRNTVVVAAIAGVASTIIGFFLAVTASLIPAGRSMRRLLQFIPIAPLTVPALVGALGWVFLATPRNGWLNILIRAVTGSDAKEGPLNIFSVAGVTVVTTLYVVPFVFTVLDGSIQRLNSESLEAMLVSGSGALGMLVRTAFGILRPALLGAFTLAVVQALSIFTVALMLRVDVLTTTMYREANVNSRLDIAAAASLPLVVLAVGLTLLQLSLLAKSNRFATVTGKGKSGKDVSFGRFGDGSLKAMSILYLILTSVLPLGAIALVSVMPFWTSTIDVSNLGLHNYQAVWENAQIRSGFRNSLVIALLCSIASVVLTVTVVVLAERLRDTAGRVAFVLANLPLGIPHVVLGLGFLVAFIKPPIVLYGTIWLLVVAYLVSFLPITIRNVAPVMQQISSELEEAALVAGSSRFGSLSRVTLPLTAPAIAASTFLLFIILFREFPIASFLATPGLRVAALSLLDAYNRGSMPLTAAIAITISLISTVGIVVSLTIAGRVRMKSMQ